MRVLIGLALVVACVPSVRAQSRPGRLLAVSSASDPSMFVVLLEVSEEVRYRTRQPDALSLVVELRNVTGRSADNRFAPVAGGIVQGVSVEERREADDAFTTVVRLAMARPAPYRVATMGGTVRIEFPRVPGDEETAGTGGGVAAPTGTLEAFAASEIATQITGIDTRRVADGVAVTLRGNGRLLPGYIGPVGSAPPRLMLDFPDVTASVPSLLTPDVDPIDQIRVALNSRTPLVTRVVLDLAADVDYEVLPSELNVSELTLLIHDRAAASPVAGSAGVAMSSARSGAAPPSVAVGDPHRIEPMAALERAPADPEDALARSRWVDDPAVVAIRPEPSLDSRPLGDTMTPSPALPLPAPAPARAEATPEATAADRPVPTTGPLPVAPPEPVRPLEAAPARAEAPMAGAPTRIDPGVALEATPLDMPAIEPESEPAAVPAPVAAAAPEPQQVPAGSPLVLGDTSVGEVGPPAAGSPQSQVPAVSPAPSQVPSPPSAGPADAVTVPPEPSPPGGTPFAPGPPPVAEPPAVPEPPAAVAPPPAAPQPAESQYTGHLVTLDFQSADLRAVLRTFAEISGLNMVIDPTVEGTVDVSLRDVPWDQALDIILRANKLGYSVDGTVVRIVPLVVLAEEEEERRRLADAQALAGELHVITQTLSYARATDLAQLLTRTVLSPRGSAQVDERTNTLILNDLPDRLDTAMGLIGTLDRPEPQVEIEARIVQTTRDFARAIGVQWGVNGRMSQELGNTSGLVFPNTGSVSGRTGVTQGPPGDRASGFEQTGTAVDLGVEAASSALGVALGSVNGAFNLDVVLSALERSGNGRVLSTPRVSTQNNIEAEVTQGIQIPIQTVANNTVTVTFKDAALTLRVTPQITSADTVIMRITLENASPDFTRQVNGIPPIDTQRANTQVQVDDGATTVIGGIFISREQQVTDRTPFLHRIPLLGWLFKREDVRDESRELLIFITPRILR